MNNILDNYEDHKNHLYYRKKSETYETEDHQKKIYATL